MFSKTQFPFHLFYTALLLIIRQTSFFGKHFFQAKSTTRSLAFNASKRNRLLSGDVELNPGPVLDCKISSVALVCNTTPAFLLKIDKTMKNHPKMIKINGVKMKQKFVLV